MKQKQIFIVFMLVCFYSLSWMRVGIEGVLTITKDVQLVIIKTASYVS